MIMLPEYRSPRKTNHYHILQVNYSHYSVLLMLGAAARCANPKNTFLVIAKYWNGSSIGVMNTLTIEELNELAGPFRIVQQEVPEIRGLEAADFGMGVPQGVEDAQDQRVAQGVANAEFQEAMIDDFNERLKSGRKSTQERSKPKESNQGSTKSSPTSMAMSARDLGTTSQIMSRRASAEAADEQLRLRRARSQHCEGHSGSSAPPLDHPRQR